MSEFKTSAASFANGTKNFVIGSGTQLVRSKVWTLEDVLKDKIISQSLLNTAVYDNLIFKAGSYTDLKGAEITYKQVTIDNAIIEVTQRKNIVKTQIQGRNGTIKELVSMGDYEISIRGGLQNYERSEQGLYPIELATDLRKICESTQALHIMSKFLSEVFDVTFIVIESFTVPQVEGMRNIQPFSISALSDVEYETPELI